MGILLTLSAYTILLIFLGISFSRVLALWKAAETVTQFSSARSPAGLLLLLKTAGDIIFLTRLLRSNDLLWIGEWLFHCSFVLVVLRHLRFVLSPVPEWVWFIQPFGLVAGYLLPFTLLYIFVMKTGKEKAYFPFYNLFLVVLLFLISVTGLLMRTLFRVDVTAVKEFMTGILTFAPVRLADGALFSLHFALVLVLVAFLPAHMFAAPFVAMEARKHEETTRRIVHEK